MSVLTCPVAGVQAKVEQYVLMLDKSGTLVGKQE